MELRPGIRVWFREFNHTDKKMSDYDHQGTFLALGVQCDEYNFGIGDSSSFIIRMPDGTIRNIFAENCKID